jgi:hypothetical protein
VNEDSLLLAMEVLTPDKARNRRSKVVLHIDANVKRLYRTRAELLASPFTPERDRASGKALTLIGH